MGTITQSKRQLAWVFDLNKCIGCQTCSVACKVLWPSEDPGTEQMWWMTVNTQPGRGTPRDWETMGGGYDAAGTLQLGQLADRRRDRRRLELQLRGGAARRPGPRRAPAEDLRQQDLGHELGRGRGRRRVSRTPTSSTCRACATTARSPRASRRARTTRSSSATRTAWCCATRTSARARSTAGGPARTRRSTSTRCATSASTASAASRASSRAWRRPACASARDAPRSSASSTTRAASVHKLVREVEGRAAAAPRVRHAPERLLRAAAVAGAAARRRQLRRGRRTASRRRTSSRCSARRCTGRSTCCAPSSTRSGAARTRR